MDVPLALHARDPAVVQRRPDTQHVSNTSAVIYLRYLCMVIVELLLSYFDLDLDIK